MNEERITSVIGTIAPNESAIGRIKENLEKKKREFKRRMFGKFKALTVAVITLFTAGILPITLFAKKINTVTVMTAVEMVAPISPQKWTNRIVPIDANAILTMLFPIRMVEIKRS